MYLRKRFYCLQRRGLSLAICRLRQIRRLVGLEVTAQLVSAFILSWLDYCNSVLAGLPRCTTEPLQHVLNAAARLVLNLRLHEHLTPSLQQLHWLPIDYRITYKLCLIWLVYGWYALCAYQPCITVLIGLCSVSCTLHPTTWSQIL